MAARRSAVPEPAARRDASRPEPKRLRGFGRSAIVHDWFQDDVRDLRVAIRSVAGREWDAASLAARAHEFGENRSLSRLEGYIEGLKP